MKRAWIAASGFLLTAAPSVAQPAAPGQPVTLSVGLQRGYNNIKLNVTQSADKLSDADYGFKVGTMAETRTFGQLFSHIAQAQFGTCAAVKGVANPVQGQQLEQTLKTKADVTKMTHSNEMYGTSAAYLRAKGIVPPSTERATMGRGAPGC